MNRKTIPLSRCTLVLLFALIGGVPLVAGTIGTIRFSGGYTKAILKEGRETIVLSEGAMVEIDTMTFSADTIEISGADARYITGTGEVRIVDSARSLEITSSNILYDRQEETILIDGWVEIQDLENQIIAQGAYLSYQQSSGQMILQICAKLVRHTDSGPMVCRSDSIRYDRENLRLVLNGNSSVYWNGDVYEASSATVDLETEEIMMEGTIKGTLHG
ncbi:MAG: LptA/OstA family protein [Sphaerochaetaceae bacterium]